VFVCVVGDGGVDDGDSIRGGSVMVIQLKGGMEGLKKKERSERGRRRK